MKSSFSRFSSASLMRRNWLRCSSSVHSCAEKSLSHYSTKRCVKVMRTKFTLYNSCAEKSLQQNSGNPVSSLLPAKTRFNTRRKPSFLFFSRALLLARSDSTSHSAMSSRSLSVHGRTTPPPCLAELKELIEGNIFGNRTHAQILQNGCQRSQVGHFSQFGQL